MNWTKEEIETLKEFSSKETSEELSKRLKRTPKAIQDKITELGVQRKNIKKLTEYTPEVIRAIAKRYAMSHGLKDHTDDFASYCIVRLYENKLSTFEYMCVDYKRTLSGNLKYASNKIKANAYHSYKQISDKNEIERSIYFKDPLETFELIHDVRITGENRICFLLNVVFGLTQKEIGLVFGVTEGRICQIIARAEGLVRQNEMQETKL